VYGVDPPDGFAVSAIDCPSSMAGDVGVGVPPTNVTVNVPVTSCPPTSVAITRVPEAPFGTLNVQLKSPIASVIKEPPPVQLEIATPSRTNSTVLVTEKPVPHTVTVVPTGPWVGPTATAGRVITNPCGVVTLSVAVSSPTTLWLPGVSLGIANVQEKSPVASVLILFPRNAPSEHALGLWRTESNKTYAPDDAVNQDPVTVYDPSTGPCVGLTEIVGGGSPRGWAAAINPVELGTAGEGVGVWDNETTLELPTVIVKVWLAEPADELTGEIVTVGDALAPPDDDDGATTAPTEASAAAPSMMIDTAMANPTARPRGDQRCAFIPSLENWNDGVSEQLRHGQTPGPA